MSYKFFFSFSNFTVYLSPFIISFLVICVPAHIYTYYLILFFSFTSSISNLFLILHQFFAIKFYVIRIINTILLISCISFSYAFLRIFITISSLFSYFSQNFVYIYIRVNFLLHIFIKFCSNFLIFLVFLS